MSAKEVDEHLLTLLCQPAANEIKHWEANGITLVKQIFDDPIMYRVTVADYERAASLFSRASIVQHFRRAVEVHPRTTEPNDPLYAGQWHLENIGAPEAWDIAATGETRRGVPIVLGIFDSGFEKDHPDLESIYWQNEEEIPNDGIDNDLNGYIDDYCGVDLFSGSDSHKRDKHGTQVVGAMAAQSNNEIGVSGIAWNSKVLLMSKSVGSVFDTHFIEAYNYAIQLRKKFNESNGDKGAFIVSVNTSLGITRAFPSEYPEWCAVYETLGRAGILAVCATDNQSFDVDIFGDMPASCPSEYLISVTASNQSDDLAEEVAFGNRHIDLAAPGVDIQTTDLGGDYAINDGTSLAAPLVNGAIACMYMAASEPLLDLTESNPSLAALEIRRLLLQSVKVTNGLDRRVASNGRLDLAAAVKAAESYQGLNAPENLNMTTPEPNPVEDVINITLSLPRLDPVEFILMRVPTGSEVLRLTTPPFQRVGEMPYRIQTGNLAAGAYVLIATQADQTVEQKIVIIGR